MAKSVHSRFGGSSYARWSRCTGSVVLAAHVIDVRSSDDANDGTFAHMVAEHCLRQGYRSAKPLVGCSLPHGVCSEGPYSGRIVTRANADAVNFYLDAVWEEFDRYPGAELIIEHAFDMNVPNSRGESYGMADAMVWHPAVRRLVVFDYKNGTGVAVSADDNEQEKFYGVGVVFSKPEWKPAEVELVIVQPNDWRNNLEGSAGEVRRWPMPLGELVEFADQIDKAIGRCREQELIAASSPVKDVSKIALDLNAGDWCRFCPAAGAGLCSQREKQVMNPTGLTVSDVHDLGVNVLPDPATLPLERLGQIMAAGELLSQWVKQVYSYTLGLAESGVDISATGHKLVLKNGRAKWTENDEQIAAYLEMVYGVPASETLSLRVDTITNVERLLKQHTADKAAFSAAKDDVRLRFTLKDSSGVTLVPIGNGREAVNAAEMAVTGLSIPALPSQ
jgi:hypothetical protein